MEFVNEICVTNAVLATNACLFLIKQVTVVVNIEQVRIPLEIRRTFTPVLVTRQIGDTLSTATCHVSRSPVPVDSFKTRISQLIAIDPHARHRTLAFETGLVLGSVLRPVHNAFTAVARVVEIAKVPSGSTSSVLVGPKVKRLQALTAEVVLVQRILAVFTRSFDSVRYKVTVLSETRVGT